jgi:hypothetical protein
VKVKYYDSLLSEKYILWFFLVLTNTKKKWIQVF